MPIYNDVDIVCPFYKRLSFQGIHCEGLTDESSLKLEFKSPSAMNTYRRVFCSAKCSQCKIYKLLEAKYE
jgi:hypothetical protein